MTQRALITGMCGFVGSHLAERLLHEGWCVDGIDHHADAGNLAAVRDRVCYPLRTTRGLPAPAPAYPPPDARA